jgi:RNA polymerase sigma-70 factor (ECF subfamily)
MDIRSILYRIAENDDQEAFKVFFKLYHRKLLEFALLYVKSQFHAEDIVSDVLVQLLKRKQIVFKMENFEGYLFLCVKNQALNFLKKKSNQLTTGPAYLAQDNLTTDYLDPLQKLLDNELRERIITATESLPPKRKMVYKLIKDDGLKYKEVANLLEISERTVENHLDAAVKDLKSAVKLYLSEKKSNTPIIKFRKAISITLFIVSVLGAFPQ